MDSVTAPSKQLYATFVNKDIVMVVILILIVLALVFIDVAYGESEWG